MLSRWPSGPLSSSATCCGPTTPRRTCATRWRATCAGSAGTGRAFAPFVANKGDATKLEEVYAVVLNAQQAAIRAVRPGVQAQTVDAAARAVITDAGYGDFFGHGLGHGIGLQVHEAPAIRPLSTTVLQPGMVFTIEPGIYL